MNVKYRHEEDDLFPDPTMLRQLVGILNYLTITQIDISFAVQQVSQFMQAHHHLHLVAVRRIICYLLGTSTHGLFFPNGYPIRLNAFSDSTGCPDTRRSVTGHGKVIWLRGLLLEIGFPQSHPTPLHADNISSIQIVTNPIFMRRSNTSK
ncbi:uncharacterized mitochondrial protein AtMg00240-like [Solanum lycopersicum]|uniref:uncharacterized mitochondrial protein AtMg00240-like n=1 Tax=Solanum lycopersicum TaxID=4081 RepID=UPI0002BCBB55|nr:uncharacterized protein LOC109121290 [Solanum lycopersicum]